MLFVPLVIWQMVELFVLPIDFFTFRFWEAVSTNRVFLLPGPFYPNIHLEKYSAGNRAPRGPRKKLIRFQSDKYGLRNPLRNDKTYEIVVIGDSNFVGSYTDEPDTIRAQLELRCNCDVYSHASGLWTNIISYLEDGRFKLNPPKYVVFEFRPGDIKAGNMQIFRPCAGSPYPSRTLIARMCNSGDSGLLSVLTALGLAEYPAILVLIDRFLKQPGYQFLHARLRLTARPNVFQAVAAGPDEHTRIENSKEALRSYRSALNERGSELLLFLMPGDSNDNSSIPSWLSDLREESFDVISIDSTSTPPNILSSWWMKDDSHWREESITFSAGLILKEMSALSEKSNLPTH